MVWTVFFLKQIFQSRVVFRVFYHIAFLNHMCPGNESRKEDVEGSGEGNLIPLLCCHVLC